MKQNHRCSCQNGNPHSVSASCSSCGRCGGARTSSCSCSAFRARPWNEEGACGRCGGPVVARNLCQNGCGNASRSTYRCQEERSCGCSEGAGSRATEAPCGKEPNDEKGDAFLHGKSLAMVYSPSQGFDSLYDPKEGLCRGTVFHQLNKPFQAYGRK